VGADAGRALRGPGSIVAADGLEPFLMLGGLAGDPEASQMAEALPGGCSSTATRSCTGCGRSSR
jgi:hypothetical protein